MRLIELSNVCSIQKIIVYDARTISTEKIDFDFRVLAKYKNYKVFSVVVDMVVDKKTLLLIAFHLDR